MTEETLPAGAGWRVLAASVTGASHRARGQPCQDAHAWELFAGEAVAAAVADGAGSAELGEIGAQAAVAAVIREIRRGMRERAPRGEEAWRGLLTASLAAARDAVLREAEERGRSPRDLACTLIVAVAAGEELAAAQIGDGAAVAEEPGGLVRAVTRPAHGEYLNETTFLVSPNALETAQFEYREGRLAGFALFSDGLQGLALKLPAGEPHAPFFKPLFAFARGPAAGAGELASWLSSEKVSGRTDDDLTLVLATRGGS